MSLLSTSRIGDQYMDSQEGNTKGNESWFVKSIWSWLYSSGGSKELWAETFLRISWTVQQVS